VQEVEGEADLRGVEARVFLREAPLPLHVEHEVATSDELDDEEEPRGSLEAGVEADEEGVIRGRLEHVLLRLHPVDVLVVGDQGLLYHLHSVNALRLLQLDHEDLGVGAASDYAYKLKVREAVLAIARSLRAGDLVQGQLLPLDVAHRTCEFRDYGLSLQTHPYSFA
jgi:hypothetical protein